MSFELLERIFKHLESMNLITPDSVVIDFMAGTGRTGTMAALRRYRTISVELEPHFIEMIAGYDCDGRSISDFKIEPCLCKSDTLHKPHKIKTGLFNVECSGNPRIVPVCRCGVKRPHKKHHVSGNKGLLEQVTGRKATWDIIQGDARELLRLMNLPDRPIAAIVSPPYAEAQQGGGIAIKGYRGAHMHEQGKNQPDKVGQTCGYMKEAHGHSLANIGNMKYVPFVAVVSPPYQDTSMPMGCPSHIRKLAQEGDWDKAIELERKYESDYAKKGNKYGVSTDETIRKKIEMALEREKGNYSENPDNIGNLSDNQAGESYLTAMLKVYQQAYLCGISPLVVVTKNPTRNGKLRRLDLDTIFLLQKSGYEIFDYHRAILFETHTQSTLEGDSKGVYKGRISFFKRLSLEKGTTVAQFEDIIFARIPIKMRAPKINRARPVRREADECHQHEVN